MEKLSRKKDNALSILVSNKPIFYGVFAIGFDIPAAIFKHWINVSEQPKIRCRKSGYCYPRYIIKRLSFKWLKEHAYLPAVNEILFVHYMTKNNR